MYVCMYVFMYVFMYVCIIVCIKCNLHSQWSSPATCTCGVFLYADSSIYWCAQTHMGTHCNLHCVVVFVVCGSSI